MNDVRRETTRTFREKARKYMKKFNKLGANNKKNTRGLYKGIK
jgi:hypothetical protein